MDGKVLQLRYMICPATEEGRVALEVLRIPYSLNSKRMKQLGIHFLNTEEVSMAEPYKVSGASSRHDNMTFPTFNYRLTTVPVSMSKGSQSVSRALQSSPVTPIGVVQ